MRFACKMRGVNIDLGWFERNSRSLSLGSSEIGLVEYFGVTAFVPLTKIYSARPPTGKTCRCFRGARISRPGWPARRKLGESCQFEARGSNARSQHCQKTCPPTKLSVFDQSLQFACAVASHSWQIPQNISTRSLWKTLELSDCRRAWVPGMKRVSALPVGSERMHGIAQSRVCRPND